jgi:hypothetical protein
MHRCVVISHLAGPLIVINSSLACVQHFVEQPAGRRAGLAMIIFVKHFLPLAVYSASHYW